MAPSIDMLVQSLRMSSLLSQLCNHFRLESDYQEVEKFQCQVAQRKGGFAATI